MAEKQYSMEKLIILFLVLISHFDAYSALAGETPKRIISLAPSITETLFALGLGDNIVGVTNFCDFPEEAKKKPKIGGMSNPSLDAVVSLKPDIVVVTTGGNPREFEERLRSMKIRTFVFGSRRLKELPGGIRDLGVAMGVRERADKLAKEMETTLNSFNNSLRVTRDASLRKKVLFIIWPEPLIVAGPGTLIDDVIRLLDNENIASRAKATYPKYSIEEIIHQAPDVIIIGKGHVDMKEASSSLLERLKSVPAVKNKNVCYVSDSLYRLGPRVAQGIEEFAGCLR